jgi:DNA-binding NarL/FixJ family response regulator
VSVWHALEAGALGYILKEVLITDLLPAIHALSQGDRFFSEKISAIANRYVESDHAMRSLPTAARLDSSARDQPNSHPS